MQAAKGYLMVGSAAAGMIAVGGVLVSHAGDAIAGAEVDQPLTHPVALSVTLATAVLAILLTALGWPRASQALDLPADGFGPALALWTASALAACFGLLSAGLGGAILLQELQLHTPQLEKAAAVALMLMGAVYLYAAVRLSGHAAHATGQRAQR